MMPAPATVPHTSKFAAAFQAATIVLRTGSAPDEFSLVEWLDRYIVRRRHFIWGIVKDEDVVQDVCCKICAAASRSPHRFAQMVYEGRDRAWLIVVARRTKIDHLRRQREFSMPVTEDGSPVFLRLPDPAPDPERQYLLLEVAKLYDEGMRVSRARGMRRTLDTPEARENREAVRRSRIRKRLRAMLL